MITAEFNNFLIRMFCLKHGLPDWIVHVNFQVPFNELDNEMRMTEEVKWQQSDTMTKGIKCPMNFLGGRWRVLLKNTKEQFTVKTWSWQPKK